MTAETVIATVICFVGMAPIIILGIVQYKSKSPVGFWSGEEPPGKEQITDVKAYNHKHGLMWIFYGIGFIICFMTGLMFGGEAAAALAFIECVGGLFVMIAYHNKLKRMYFKR